MKNPFKNIFTKSDQKYTLYKSVGNGGSVGSVTPARGLELNEVSLYLNRGIGKRSEKVGEIEFLIKNEKGEVDTEHWLNKLLDNPSKVYTGDQFWRLANTYKDATGFVVMRKIKGDNPDKVFDKNKKDQVVTGLQIYNSAKIKVNLSTDEKSIESFTYNGIADANETIPYDEAIYWYNPDPKNPLLGLPLITAGLRAVLTDLDITAHQSSVIRNGGVVDSVLTFKNAPNAEALAKIKKDYKAEYGTTTNTGVPLILGGETKFERLGLSPAEMSFIESRGLLIDDMAVITSVPTALMGVTSGETFANAEVGYGIFLRETIRPILKDLTNVLNWKLAPEKIDITFDDPTPKDQDQILKKLDAGTKAQAMTLNEKRDLLGLGEIEGGDVVDRTHVKEPVATPEPAKAKAGIFTHPLKNKDFRADYYKNYLKSLQSKERDFKKDLKKYFAEQEQRVLSAIGSRKQVKIKGIEDDIFNENLEIELTFPLLRDLENIAKEMGQETMEIFSSGQQFIYTDNLSSAVDKRYNFFAKSINSTTAKDIKKEVTKWLANEESINQLKERMKTVYNTIDDARLTTIALTESASVSQLAKMETYKQVGIRTKIWVWSAGTKGGVREDHASIDGEERPFEAPFSNGMMHPHDPNFGAGENINCECSI